MYEVRVGADWYDVIRIEADGSVLVLYGEKFRGFSPSAYDEVREKEAPKEKKEEKEAESAEKTPTKRVTRKKAVKESD